MPGRCNIVLIGGIGTGKTHLAAAVTASVVRAGARGRYFNTVDLVSRLEEEARIGKAGTITANLAFGEWHTVFGVPKMTTALRAPDFVAHHAPSRYRRDRQR